MRQKKLIFISALILLMIIPAVFAQGFLGGLAGNISGFLGGLTTNSWFIFFVNSSIIWIILIIAQAVILQGKEGKQQVVMWLVSSILAVIIAYNFGGGTVFIWKAGSIAKFFNLKIITNTLIISAAIWFGLGLAGVDPKTKPGQIGMVVLAIIVAVMIANTIGDKWLWDTSNFKSAKDFFFGADYNGTFRGQPKRLGGILRPEGPPVGQYRLFIFIGSAVLWSWFLTGFLKLDNPKLSYAISILVGAIQAYTGTPYGVVIAMAEAFFLLMIGSQTSKGGGIGGLLWTVLSIVLVEFIFCSLVGSSALYTLLSDTLGNQHVGTKGGWIDFGTPLSFLKSTDPCCVVNKLTNPGYKCGTGGGGPGGTPSTTTSPPPGGGLISSSTKSAAINSIMGLIGFAGVVALVAAAATGGVALSWPIAGLYAGGAALIDLLLWWWK